MPRQVVISNQTRLFINKDGLNGCSSFGAFEYADVIGLGNLSESRSGNTVYYAPSKETLGEYDAIFNDKGSVDSGSTSINMYFQKEKESELRKLFQSECAYDLQVHIGECDVPTNANKYAKSLLLYGATFTSFDVENPFAADSSNRNMITESSNISYLKSLEIIKPNLTILTENFLENGPVINSGFYFEPSCSNICGVSNGLFLTQLRYDPDCDQFFYWINFNDNCLGQNIKNLTQWDSYQDLYNPLAAQIKITNSLRLTDDGLYHSGILWPKRFQSPDNFPELINILHTTEPLSINAHVYKRTDNAMIGDDGFVQIFNNEWKTVTFDDSVDYYDVDYYDDKWLVAGAGGVIRLIYSDTYYENINFVVDGLISTESIIKVAFLSNDTYVIATDAGNIYKTINNGKRWKRIHKDKYVEQWVWFDHYVGYISYLDNTGNLVIGQTINGGYSYTKLGESLSRNMHVLEMRISPKNPNYIVISGRILLLTPTNDELLLPTANSNQTDKGFVIIGR